MNHLVKAIILSLGVASVAGLTACQSNSPQQTAQHSRKVGEYQKHHHKKGDGEFKHKHKMTDEQRAQKREQMQQRHAERKAQFEALQKACEGKAGQNISVKIGEKTLEGSCEVHFKPNRPERPKA